MALSVDEKLCIGCGVCAQISPSLFHVDDHLGRSCVLKPEVPEAEMDNVNRAIEFCPVSCITL